MIMIIIIVIILIIILSVEDIEKSANALAYGSTNDNFGLSVECILYSYPIIFMQLKSLYDACLAHG